MAAPLGAILRVLHHLPTTALSAAGLPGDTLGRLDLDRRLPPLREHLRTLVAQGILAAADPWLPILDQLPRGPRPTCLLHGDLYACHLLVEGEQLTGVIDWGDVHAGDPAVDLMLLYSFLPATARGAFLAAYGPVDEPTRRLARFRALCHTANVLLYAHHRGDDALLSEGQRSLAHLAA